VGTTTVRTLESATDRERSRWGFSAFWKASSKLSPRSGEVNLYICPGYRFRIVDALMTNFHLPRSTLLVLVRTFGGEELMKRAYEEAIREEYRFFSYGDAMLIV
jgi:S-adenosylmethionine:tRNA ribosyltransferase-isomerase